MLDKVLYIFIYSIFLLYSTPLFSQSNRSDSLKKELTKTKNDSIKISLLNRLIDNEPEVTVYTKYYEQLLKISEKNAQKLESPLDTFYFKNYATTLNNIAAINQLKGNSVESLQMFKQALKIYEQLNDKSNITACLINIGGAFDNQGDMKKALEYYHKALRILESNPNKEALVVCLINLGNVYKKLNDYPTALKYYETCLKVSLENKDKKGIAASYNYIGIIYQNTAKKQQALEYYKKSLQLNEEINDKLGIAKSLNNIGNIYKQEKNWSEALDYFNKGLIIYNQVQDKKGTANCLDNVAQIYLLNDEIKMAFSYAKQSFDLAKETSSPKVIMQSAITMKRIYQKQNKFKEAFEMFELETKMRDSIYNQENQKEAVKKQMQYLYERKELEAKAEQDKKDIVAKQKLKQKETERNYFIFGFCLFVSLSLFILRGYNQKQKANKIITQQKHLVEEKQKEILASIQYAKRIQTALLPNEKYISKNLEQLIKR